jgi:hypothetical protein
MLWSKSMNQNIKVSLQLLNNILAYMGTRPYTEVFQLVKAIQDEAQGQLQQPEMVISDEAAKPVTDAA